MYSLWDNSFKNYHCCLNWYHFPVLHCGQNGSGASGLGLGTARPAYSSKTFGGSPQALWKAFAQEIMGPAREALAVFPVTSRWKRRWWGRTRGRRFSPAMLSGRLLQPSLLPGRCRGACTLVVLSRDYARWCLEIRLV